MYFLNLIVNFGITWLIDSFIHSFIHWLIHGLIDSWNHVFTMSCWLMHLFLVSMFIHWCQLCVHLPSNWRLFLYVFILGVFSPQVFLWVCMWWWWWWLDTCSYSALKNSTFYVLVAQGKWKKNESELSKKMHVSVCVCVCTPACVHMHTCSVMCHSVCEFIK